MPKQRVAASRLGYHVLAIFVVLVWGATFVNSKILIQHGLQVHEIFVIRFLLAYVCIWFLPPRRLWSDNWRDELRMLLLGLTGGSLYFVTENMAVRLDYVNNVSFIVCTAPLLTTLLALVFVRGLRPTPRLLGGSLLALVGVALVVFNGQFVLRLNPLGDAMAFAAALCWAVYSLLMRGVSRYSAVFVTRKVFAYGLLTVLPFFWFHPWQASPRLLFQPVVAANLLFLGLVASFACFALWSLAIKKIGVVSTSNYVYLNPVTTVLASALFLDEPMTSVAYLGSALILGGVILANARG